MHIVHDHQTVRYIRTGVDMPSGTLWQWLTRDKKELHSAG
jgi:hypothetical protein